MRKIGLIYFFMITAFAYSQDVRTLMVEKTAKIENALIQGDTLMLHQLLHENLSFGHSNAYIESKRDVLNDVKTKKITYTLFEPLSEIELTVIDARNVIIRRKIRAVGTFEKYHFDLNMNVLEIWTLDNHAWKLIARQGVKLPQ